MRMVVGKHFKKVFSPDTNVKIYYGANCRANISFSDSGYVCCFAKTTYYYGQFLKTNAN